MRRPYTTYLPIALLFLLALGMRLVVWHWRAFYPLGGDEQEYLNQALTLLQEHRYVELQLMRPPLYGVFLAGSILLVDSLVQHLRLIQALISAATVVPIWLLTREMGRWYAPDKPALGRRAALLAALLCALSYTLAVNATELLTETLFLFGLTTLFWLLLDAARRNKHRRLISAALAGVLLGMLCLTRAVALPLLPLGILWLLLARPPTRDNHPDWRAGLLFGLVAVLVILPWTVRNYATYGGLILIDTTGAENLWLDNDPAGREAVKAQLYALKEDRLARQQLAADRGLAVVLDQPGRFAYKAWGELQKFFALEYVDDMQARRAIWLPPAEVWGRLLLGDALWLLLVLLGSFGLVLGRWTMDDGRWTMDNGRWTMVYDPRWLCVPWALYLLLTALIFHVELRYRLPLYPVLLPYAAWVIAGSQWRVRGRSLSVRYGLTWLPVVSIVLLMLLHRPYPRIAWDLGWKHLRLAQSEAALARNDPVAAQRLASAALAHDQESALARVALARAALQSGDAAQAEVLLQAAVKLLPFHPQAHVLLGDLWRQQGHLTLSPRELAFETASLQNLQQWGWHWFISPPASNLDIGGGLDLGFIQGFYAPEIDGFRWTTGHAQMRLARPDGLARLHLRMASGRPEQTPRPMVAIYADDRLLGRFAVASGWREYVLLLPHSIDAVAPEVVIELRSDTFTPRTYDSASPDGRTLGVMVDGGWWAGDDEPGMGHHER